MPAHSAILLAPLDLDVDHHRLLKNRTEPSEGGDLLAALEPLLKGSYVIPVHCDAIAVIRKPLAACGIVVDNDSRHQCFVSKSGVQVMKLWVTIVDVAAFLRGVPPSSQSGSSPSGAIAVDRELARWLYVLACKVLLNKDAEPKTDVDYTYTIVETGSFVHDDSETPAPIELGRTGIKVWVTWGAAQFSSFDIQFMPERFSVEFAVLPFVVRCACHKLLLKCGERAARALAALELEPGRGHQSLEPDPVASLRDLQTSGARLLTAFQISLWTHDWRLRRIFDEIDRVWNVEDELENMRELLTAVGAVLSAQHSIQTERRAEALSFSAVALAGVSLVSAFNDAFELVENSTPMLVLALLAVVVLILALRERWAPHS